jgi:uncharacterized protein (DUF488 family)
MKIGAKKRSTSRLTTLPLVLTVGHSTRPLEEFIALLRTHVVTRLVDVRTIPRSRHNPQFNADALPAPLNHAGIAYVHLPGLGGLRHTTPTSPNTGWRNSSFRGFADYMQTAEFEHALKALIQLTPQGQLALMCAEAVPWRCHRSLIADALLVRGYRVEHIMSATNRQPHKLTPFAKVHGTHVLYPPEPNKFKSQHPKALANPKSKKTSSQHAQTV